LTAILVAFEISLQIAFCKLKDMNEGTRKEIDGVVRRFNDMTSYVEAESAQEEENPSGLQVKAIIISLIVSIVLSKFSKGSMCSYMLMSLFWLYLSVVISQAFSKFERGNRQIAMTACASLIGWVIGTILLWKNRDLRLLFFE
jgi:CHASE2 domain-containing sensor protein